MLPVGARLCDAHLPCLGCMHQERYTTIPYTEIYYTWPNNTKEILPSLIRSHTHSSLGHTGSWQPPQQMRPVASGS
jgi:hypothetical protein